MPYVDTLERSIVEKQLAASNNKQLAVKKDVQENQ